MHPRSPTVKGAIRPGALRCVASSSRALAARAPEFRYRLHEIHEGAHSRPEIPVPGMDGVERIGAWSQLGQHFDHRTLFDGVRGHVDGDLRYSQASGDG